MKIKKAPKSIVIILAVLLILPTGLMAYSMIDDQISQTISEENTPNTDVSAEVQELIRQSDPADFDRNMTNYTNLLVRLDVHSKFKSEIERLIQEGHKLPDILTAYDFLNECYGKMQDIETLVKEKEAGKSWTAVFESYDSNNPEFVPGSFDSDYLERLKKTPGITTDDIMIGDRVSQKTSIPFSDIIEKKLDEMSWKTINAELDIVNAQAALPHVPVTPENIDKYVDGGMNRDKVILAYVIAMKMEVNAEEIINLLKSGESKEQIYARYYTQKYY